MEFTPYRGSRVRQLGRTEIRNLFDILELADGLAARRAAENIGVGDNRARMQRALSNFENADFAQGNAHLDGSEDDLRGTVYAVAGNELLEQMVGRLQFSIVPVQLRSFHTHGVPQYLLGLVRSYVDAIITGDARSAEAGSRAHMRALRDHILDLPDDLFRTGATALR
jgi:DNA-binding GntR family transcriptional regulator